MGPEPSFSRHVEFSGGSLPVNWTAWWTATTGLTGVCKNIILNSFNLENKVQKGDSLPPNDVEWKYNVAEKGKTQVNPRIGTELE